MRDQLRLEYIVRDLEASFNVAWDAFADFEFATMSHQDESYYEESLHDHVKSIYVRLAFIFEALGLSGHAFRIPCWL